VLGVQRLVTTSRVLLRPVSVVLKGSRSVGKTAVVLGVGHACV
jgi:hypothetical protein